MSGCCTHYILCNTDDDELMPTGTDLPAITISPLDLLMKNANNEIRFHDVNLNFKEPFQIDGRYY